MSDLYLRIAVSIAGGIMVFFGLIMIGPPKKWWCNSKEYHEFGQWQDFEGPSRNHHYQSKTCKKCGYKEIRQTYIGMMN